MRRTKLLGHLKRRKPKSSGSLLPDVRDGLTQLERVILWQLGELQKKEPGRRVPTAMLYGYVVEHCNVPVAEFQAALQRLTGNK